MGLFSKLGKLASVVLDAMSEADFLQSTVMRKVQLHGVTYDEVKGELQKRIEDKNLYVKAETSEGYKAVGLVRKLTATEIHFSPSKTNRYDASVVVILRNHTNKVVARGKGRWIDSGMSFS
nr:hypothetical protein [uncultured Pseudomonas sp.]